jgi:hypothetical protein
VPFCQDCEEEDKDMVFHRQVSLKFKVYGFFSGSCSFQSSNPWKLCISM